MVYSYIVFNFAFSFSGIAGCSRTLFEAKYLHEPPKYSPKTSRRIYTARLLI